LTFKVRVTPPEVPIISERISRYISISTYLFEIFERFYLGLFVRL
jgi:hypothetical protein